MQYREKEQFILRLFCAERKPYGFFIDQFSDSIARAGRPIMRTSFYQFHNPP